MKTGKKSISFILALIMTLSVFAVVPSGASAVVSDAAAIGETDPAYPDYEFEAEEETAVITGYRGEGGEVEIPSTLGGYAVVKIGDYAFSDCTALTGVTFPNTVAVIGDSAFAGCTNLSKVTLPDSAATISESAFLKCAALTEIALPASVTVIGSGAFSGCTGLERIEVSPDNPKFDSRDACSAIIESGSNTLIYGCKNTVIPATVTRIGSGAFDGCVGLTSAVIPDSVTSIGDSAFNGCTGLKSVTVGRTVVSIGSHTFYMCTGLESIEVSPDNPNYDSRSHCNAIIETRSGVLRYGCNNTVIPDGVKMIGDSAFSFCTGLTAIGIPDSVVSIGKFAFHGCTGLTAIGIPNSVVSIDDYAFSDCSGLTSVSLSSSVTKIGSYAFSGCAGLKSIALPDSVKAIDSYAFYNCTGLTSVTVPKKVTEISKAAFHSCTALASVTLGNSVKTISDTAFFNCTALKSITIPGSVTGIGNYSFNNCTSLKSVTIPDAVTRIGNFAFCNCTSMKSAVFADFSGSIGKKAFGYTSENGIFRKVDGFTLYGYRDCPSEKYARENAFNFVEKIKMLNTPGITKLQNTASGVSVTWSYVAQTELYRVFRKTGSGSWAKVADTGETTLVDKTAKSGTKYAYTVRCVRADGKYNSDYNKTGSSILYLAQPKVTKLENAAGGTSLTWSKSGGAASYKVYIKSGKAWKNVATVKTNTYTYTGAKSGTSYTYTVRAVDKSGAALSSYNTIGWNKKFIAAPALPTLKNTKNGVQINFKGVAGAAKYRIFRKESKGKWAKLIDTTKLTVLDKTAKNGKTYSYTVRCISKDGKTYTSAYNAKGRTIKCKR